MLFCLPENISLFQYIMESVPKGNTQINVNATVLKHIKENIDLTSTQTLIDVPCGAGEFASYMKRNFPNLRVIGADLSDGAAGKDFEFHKLDAHTFLKTQKLTDVNVATCISGVMCFDGINELFGHFSAAIKKNGLLVVTNDNIMTVRDRLSFFFFGRFKRFSLLYKTFEGNWNVILPQGIWMLMERNSFKPIKVEYVAIYTEDLLFFPFALFMYPIFLLPLMMKKNPLPLKDRLKLFPFKMLLARHYVMTARKI